MRKFISLLTLICLLITCIVPVASAAVFDDTSATSGIDVVIVLDNTRSMAKATSTASSPENDINNYRLDAAAMLIGMLDMNTTRVAAISFDKEPTILSDFIPANTARDTLVTSIYNLADKARNGSGTNIGMALMEAFKLLQARSDVGNEPMVVLLTDGQNSISGNNNQQYISLSAVPHWNGSEIVEEADPNFTTESANELTIEAADCANVLGYPIYTIALNTDPDDSSSGISLRDISRKSGLSDGCYQISKKNANQLPEFFAKVLANKIGSSIQYSANPVLLDYNEKEKKYNYEVSIPILNQSVLETNIIIPVSSRTLTGSGIDASTIRMYDASGDIQSEMTGVSNVYIQNAHFSMLKIRNPKITGLWKLKFASVKRLDDNEISFNILYNYNIKLHGSVRVHDSSDTEFYKTDKLDVTASFADVDGNEVLDRSLYADYSHEQDYEDWMTIRTKWILEQINPAGSMQLAEGFMESDPDNLQFKGTIDLASYDLKSGNYVLKLITEGAGLNRTACVDLVLKNHAPIASDKELPTLHVNTPGSGNEESYRTAVTGEIPYTELYRDADSNDVVDLSFTDEESVIKLEKTDSGLKYSTIPNGDKQKFGNATFTIHYDDHDGGSGDIQLVFRVISDEDTVLDSYDPILTVSGTPSASGADDSYLKNSELTITMQLKNRDTNQFMSADELATLDSVLSIVNDSGVPAAEGISFTQDDDKLVYTLPSTGNKAEELTITAVVEPFAPVEKKIFVPNDQAPQANAEMPINVYCGAENLPSFLRFLAGNNSPEDDPALNFSAESLFADADGDVLEYSAPAFYAENGTTPVGEEKVTAESTGEHSWRLTVNGSTTSLFHYAYTIKAVLDATDGDGQTATFTRTLKVVDLKNRTITFIITGIAVALILVALFLIVRQACKPVFPKLKMIIREEPSMYDNDNPYEMAPVKTAMDINHCNVDSDMADRHSIEMKQLQSIFVSPVRSRSSVSVSCSTVLNDHEITLDGAPLKAHKKYTWISGSQLSISNRKGEGAIVLQLTEANDESTSEKDDFFSSDEFQTVDSTAAVGSVGRLTRKASRSAVQQSQPFDNDSGNDDFDF